MTRELVLPEGESARRADAIRLISLGLAAASILAEIAGVISWLGDPSYPFAFLSLVIAIGIVISLASYWLNRSGKTALAGYFFIAGFIPLCALATVLFGGFTSNIPIAYVFAIIISSMVINTRAGFITAAISSIFYLAMIPVEQTGLIPRLSGELSEWNTDAFLAAATWVISFYLIAFLSWYAASRLNRALQEVHRYAVELQDANEKLQASEEELRASNEELEAANEELRATEEELRSSNEELEAANEELRDAQEQLVRSEKLAAIGQLAGGVGHELRNPLGAIKNAAYYIKGKVARSELGQKEPRVIEFLNIMDDEINSSNKIINDLLGFSRVGKPSVSPTMVDRLLEDALSYIPIPDGVELVKKIDSDLPAIEVDADQIRQVVVNLATNAVQAMPDGGRLTVAAGIRDNLLEVKVADTGCGIPGKILKKIFDPLFTTKAKGIGLGLAVCKTIIDRHQGHIEVESEIGKGTAFTVQLPLTIKKG